MVYGTNSGLLLFFQVAHRLANTYGDKAPQVAKMATFTSKRWPIVGKRLVDEFPYIEAEVKYAMKEYACTAIDILARRTRLAFLDVQAAEEALPRIVEIMAKELNWSKSRKQVHSFSVHSTLVNMVLSWGGGGRANTGDDCVWCKLLFFITSIGSLRVF